MTHRGVKAPGHKARNGKGMGSSYFSLSWQEVKYLVEMDIKIKYLKIGLWSLVKMSQWQ